MHAPVQTNSPTDGLLDIDSCYVCVSYAHVPCFTYHSPDSFDSVDRAQGICSRFYAHYCACFCMLRSIGNRYAVDDSDLNDMVVHGLTCNL